MSPESGLVLYDYWRSSAAYRVRIALHLKGLEFEQRPVNLVRDGGEQHQSAYRALNPQGLVPALVHEDQVITQSLAICEYLEEAFSGYSLLPGDPVNRARVRAMALLVACDIHPLNNLRVQQQLKSGLGAQEQVVVAWINRWISDGFSALERQLSNSAMTGTCCFGDQPGLADCCLVPQFYNAERFGCDLAPFPLICAIASHCRDLPAFAQAAPERQPDAPVA
jgi:maleylacetoacetate isomerase